MSTDGAEATDTRRSDEQNTPSGGDPDRLLERVRCAVLGPQVAAAVVVLLMIALAALYLPGRGDGGAWQRQAVSRPFTTPGAAPGGHAPGTAAPPPSDHTLTARTDASPRAFAAPPVAGSTGGEPAAAGGDDVPSHADALLVQARKQRKARDCRAAVHTYEAFLLGHRKHPDAPQAMLEVAECHQRLTQRVRALHWLTQAARHPQASDEAGKRLQALRRLMDEGP